MQGHERSPSIGLPVGRKLQIGDGIKNESGPGRTGEERGFMQGSTTAAR